MELHQIGAEVGITTPEEDEKVFIDEKIQQFARYFGLPDALDRLRDVPVLKLFPKSARPYGNLYAY